jgi:hypothetical protein
MNAEQMQRAKIRLSDIFTNEIKPMITKIMPEKDDWNEWLAFEGAYRASMHIMRENVIRAIERNAQRIHGEKRFQSKIQKATEEAAEMPITTQTIRHNLRKLKDSLHERVERHNQNAEARAESNVQARRQQAKFTKGIGQILRLMEPEKTQESFGTTDHEEIWGELNTQQEHRDRVSEWLDAVIITNALPEVQQMTKRKQNLKTQEAYRMSKGPALKTYRVSHPPMSISGSREF